MAKFKVGDTVEKFEEIDNSSVNKKGDIGIVLEIKEYPNIISNLYRVEVENRGSSCNWEVEEDLKLIKDMQEFKVGDTVKILSSEGASRNPVGSTGIITEIDTDKTCRVIVKGFTDENIVNWHDFDKLMLVKDTFKIGDKVEVTDGAGTVNKKGDIGIITESDNDNTYRVSVKGRSVSGNWMFPSKFRLVDITVKEIEYIEVKGKDLVIGNTYYLGYDGSDKSLFEGYITDRGSKRCLFTPMGHTSYMMYSNDEYEGKYTGKLSIFLEGFFYEKVEKNKESKQLKPIDRGDLVIGKEYYIDKRSGTIGEYVGRDVVKGSVYFKIEDNKVNYCILPNGYTPFDDSGSPFYEVENKTPKKKSPAKPIKVEGTDLVIGNKYFLDTCSNTVGIYVGVDIDTNKILFDVKDNNGGYVRNSEGYIDFKTIKGNYFYEVK